MPETFREATLDNGLKILAEINPEANSAAAGFFVRTGARDERTPLMGVSHFLEHMMFKGSDGLTADDINRGFDDMGARNNAYTTGEMTCFHAHVIPERLPDALGLLSTMMRPALRQDDFDTEKNVILEEIAMYADNPFWVLYEETVDRRYRPHGLGHRVLGTTETVGALASGQMREYFEHRYSADNTVLSLAGALDFDKAVADAQRLCASWPTTGATRDETKPVMSNDAFVKRDPRVNRGYLIGISEAPAMGDEERYAAAAVAFILGGSDNSRLHWALIETGLAEEAQASYDGHAGVGDFFFYASGDPDALDKITGVIEREIEALSKSITEDDLERLRNKLATGTTLSGERPEGRMQRIGRQWTGLRRYTTLEHELEKINALTIADLRSTLKKYPMLPATTGRMLPGESTDGA